MRLVQLHDRGALERVSRGLYRLTHFPLSSLSQYMEATLWPQVRRPDARAVISHASALALHRLSDVAPAKAHITVPTTMRIRRAIPRHLVVHYADLGPEDVQEVEGVLVTTPERTIRDAHASRIGPALVRQAIEDGRRSGLLTLAQADRLEAELLGSEGASTPASPTNGAPAAAAQATS